MMSAIVRYQEFGLDLACRSEDGQVWLTTSQVAELYGVDRDTAEKHANHILEEGELDSASTAQFAVEQADKSGRVRVIQLTHWSPDMVLHIGYRVRSERGADFRRWATAVLKGEAQPIAVFAPEKPLSTLDMWEMALKAARENDARISALEAKTAQLKAVTTEIEQAVAGLVTESQARRLAASPVPAMADLIHAILKAAGAPVRESVVYTRLVRSPRDALEYYGELASLVSRGLVRWDRKVLRLGEES